MMKNLIQTLFFVFLTSINIKLCAQNGNALYLDGVNDYMVVANHNDFNLAVGENLTITCKVKTNSFLKRIISKRPNAVGIGYELINASSPGGQFGVNLTTSGGAAGPPFGTTTITDNNWHHLAMVIDVTNTNCAIYVDGTLEQSNSSVFIGGTNTVNNSGNLFFGTISNLSSFLNGQLDDIRFWNKSMTNTEIATDYTTTVTGAEPDLLAAWDFENVSGNSVTDITGHNHTGTLTNGASIIALNGTMLVQSVSLIQTELPTGIGDTDQRIIAIKVATTGNVNPVPITSFNITTNGTSNINDISNIKLYYSNTNSNFDLATSTLFGSVSSTSGTLTVNGNQTLSSGDNYFWITYDVSTTATEGNLLDATCESVLSNTTTYTPSANTITGNRVILLENTLLFTPGDSGAVCYRIPALITADDGSLVTITDKRWNNTSDLANKIDPVVRRSADMGKTWSAPLTIANFGGPNGAGDAALVLDKNTVIYCVF